MKKVIVLVFALAMVLGLLDSVHAENTAYFKLGDYNNDVIMLHRKLADLGYYYLRPESPWSEKSEDAVKILQENLGWNVTGVVEDKEQLNVILSLNRVIGKNLLLGTDEDKNYHVIDNGFNAILDVESEGIKVTSTSRDESGWLVLMFEDGKSKDILSEKEGEYFTVSFDAKSNTDNAELIIYHRCSNAKDNQITFGKVRLGSNNQWNKYILSAKSLGVEATNQGLYFDIGCTNPKNTEISIQDIKLVRGMVGTP